MQKLKKKRATKQSVKKAPRENGVYIFYAKDKTPIYIGKSTNIRKRLESYYASDLAPKTAKLMETAYYYATISVTSEIEALLLEAKLIRTYKPVYNIELKDDKHPLYIKITKEKYPRVLTARRKEEDKKANFFGPFPSSGNVKSVLKMLRRIFPFAQHKLGKRGCLYSQIDLCVPCPNEIEKLYSNNSQKADQKRKEYLKNISRIRSFLKGNIVYIKRSLEKEMRSLAAKQKYEKANVVKQKLAKLNYITQPVTPVSYFIKNPNLLEDIRKKEITQLRQLLEPFIQIDSDIKRIECFDVAHLAGSQPTASMVTFVNAEPEKKYYRHFKIRQKKGNDDVSSMKETAKRRAKYLGSWGVPDLIIVDGGRTQTKVFYEVFEEKKIRVVGLAKRYETLVIPQKTDDGLIFREKRLPRGHAKNLVQRLRDEAHRFARRYHHKLLTKELLKN